MQNAEHFIFQIGLLSAMVTDTYLLSGTLPTKPLPWQLQLQLFQISIWNGFDVILFGFRFGNACKGFFPHLREKELQLSYDFVAKEN